MKIYSCYKVKIQDAPKHELMATAEAYQSALRFFVDVCLKEWDSISSIHADPVTQKGLSDNTIRKQYVEALTHRTKDNPLPRYDFDSPFPKFPSYLRRSAIMEAIGMVQSYKSNLANWEASAKKNGKPKPPTVGRSFPSMYKGNCFLRISEDEAKLKAWVRNTWDWVTVTLRRSDHQSKVRGSACTSFVIFVSSITCRQTDLCLPRTFWLRAATESADFS